ncbi:MAG TPA: tyrosine-type recombinase/integrase [Paludibaculum sp.]|jgi:integrase
MNGTTYKRKNGTWAYQIDQGKDENGNRVRPSKGGYRTKREADAARAHALAEIEKATPQAKPPCTLGQWIVDWMERHVEPNLAATTVEGYRGKLKYLSVELCATPLSNLTPLQLEREFQRIKAEGGKERRTGSAKPVSPKTVHNVAGIVRTALEDAVRHEVITRNPATSCRLPSQERKEKRILESLQLAQFLEAAKGTRLFMLLLLASSSGCRRGELLALTHDDLRLAEGSMVVSKSLVQAQGRELFIKSPKNGKTRRIFLPALALEALHIHLAEQEETRRMYGSAYQDEPRLVFCEPDGTYWKPNTVTSWVCRLAQKCGFKGISAHSMRHTHGSQLLSEGVSLPAVSKRLGHSSPRITADIYSHSLAKDEEGAAGRWDLLMRGQMKENDGNRKAEEERMAANGSTAGTRSVLIN